MQNIFRGDDGWHKRLPKKPQRLSGSFPHPYEVIERPQCRQCGSHMKPIDMLDGKMSEEAGVCMEKWVCKCWNLCETWKYTPKLGWKVLDFDIWIRNIQREEIEEVENV